MPFLLWRSWRTLLSFMVPKGILALTVREVPVVSCEIDKLACTSSPPIDAFSSGDALLRRVFQLIDANGDGLVSTDDVEQHLGKLGLLDSLQIKEQLTWLVQSALGSGGQLDFDDFTLLYEALCESNSDVDTSSNADHSSRVVDNGLPEAFRVFDVDGDGFISVDELRQVLVRMGFAQCQDQAFCEKIVRSVDSNADGRIDFSEFCLMMH